MAHLSIKNRVSFVFFLFCLLQTQVHSKLLPEKFNSDNPYDEFFREVAQSANRIAEKLQLKLNEADIHVEKYIDKLKEQVDGANEHFQGSLQMFEENLDKFIKQVSEIVPKQVDRLVEEIRAKDPELAEKIKKLKAEFIQLKEDIIRLYEEMKKPIMQHYHEVKDEFATKTRPIVKRWTPIVKDVEDIITAFISGDKKKKLK